MSRYPSVLIRSVCALLLGALVSALAGCEATPMTSSNGKKLKLETVTHDGQTNYVYREVE